MVGTALDSLISQTYGDFELIISDNASTDATEEVCREYAARDPRIRYVRQSVNKGSAWNFNQVFLLSKGEYFKWAAADDVCSPTFLQRCVEGLDSRPDVVWRHTQSRHIDSAGNLLAPDDSGIVSYLSVPPAAPTRADDCAARRFEAVLLGRGGCLDSYGLIRADVMRQTKLLLPYFGSEKVFMAELALRGKYTEVPETLFFARIHERAAGSLRSVRQQRRYINPLSRERWQFARVKLLAAYCDAVRRAPLSLAQRTRCFAVIARYLLQVNKWKGVIFKAWSGMGLAGEYPSIATHNDSRGPIAEAASPHPRQEHSIAR
jgi:glycosyltransferase involved in cell wall biosynthesis